MRRHLLRKRMAEFTACGTGAAAASFLAPASFRAIGVTTVSRVFGHLISASGAEDGPNLLVRSVMAAPFAVLVVGWIVVRRRRDDRD